MSIKLYDGKNCPCKAKTCSRHGDCEACKKKHHSVGSKTSCERLAGMK